MARKKSDETPTESGSAGVEGGEVAADDQPTAILGTTEADSTEPAVVEPSDSGDALTDSPNPSDGPPAEPREWTVKPWQAVAALIAAVLVAGGIGSAIGAASRNGELDDLRSERQALVATQDRLERRVRGLEDRVNDREAQRRADEAAAERVAAEEAAEEAAAAKKAADDAAAAAAAQAAAEAERNTIAGDGIYAIGPEKSPGRYRTDGPSGSNSAGCYYALLRAPTSDSIDNIIDNNIVNGPGFADLQEGQFFETTSCLTWTRVG